MSNDEIRKRLDRLKAQLVEAFGSSPDGFMAVLIEGGLTPYPAIAQDDQGNEWIRNTAAGETVEDFASAPHASPATLVHVSAPSAECRAPAPRRRCGRP